MPGEDAPGDVVLRELVQEISSLYPGRGLQEPKILDRVGPSLRKALGIRPQDAALEQRRQLQVGLFTAADTLPRDLRLVLLHAFAVDPADARLLKDRLDVAATLLDRHPRSIRRRLNQAVVLVAELLARRLRQASANPWVRSTWQVESLRSTLWLDPAAPRLLEDREVVATESMSHMVNHVSLPTTTQRGDGSRDLRIVAEFGCEVTSIVQSSPSHWEYRLDFPHSLAAGDKHRFGINYYPGSLSQMRPYYVLVPFRIGNFFSAEIHFGSPSVASSAWRLDGIPPAVLNDQIPTEVLFDLVAEPTVRVEFSDVAPGLSYGVQWYWA